MHKEESRPNTLRSYEQTQRKAIACFGTMLFLTTELDKALATGVVVPVLFTKTP